MARLKELFNKEIKPSLKQQFGYKNNFMVPEIQKLDTELIKLIQFNLMNSGNYTGPLDGDFGGGSIDALNKSFQQSR